MPSSLSNLPPDKDAGCAGRSFLNQSEHAEYHRNDERNRLEADRKRLINLRDEMQVGIDAIDDRIDAIELAGQETA